MLATILVITYNHESFIAQALDSFLDQKTKFEFEIVIGDDLSTDKTREILLKYKKMYPDKIRLLLNEKNIGMMLNFIGTYNACNGKYIAVCEGDDYWIDEHKLQKQVEFMEKNPGYTITGHGNYDLRNGKLIHSDKRRNKNEQHFELRDYLLSPFFHTSSMVLRAMDILPDWYKEVLAGDNFLVLLFAAKGDIYYFPENMSVYRIHPKSISNVFRLNNLRENYSCYLRKFNDMTERKYEKEILMVIKKWELNTKWSDKKYFRKLKYFSANFLFYCRNYQRFFGIKLFFKYIIPTSILGK